MTVLVDRHRGAHRFAATWPRRMVRVVVPLFAVLAMRARAADVPVAADEQDPWTQVQAIRDAVNSPSQEANAGLDEALRKTKCVAFVMGMLLDTKAVEELLSNLERSEHPANRLVLVAFWREYGGSRTIRRLGGVASEDVESALLAIAEDAAGLARELALALLSEGPSGDAALTASRVQAIEALMRLAPESNAAESALLNALADAAAAREDEGSERTPGNMIVRQCARQAARAHEDRKSVV